jgi:hypothetical protein
MRSEAGDPRVPRAAEAAVAGANKAALDALPFADRRDFDDAERGFSARFPTLRSRRASALCGRKSRTASCNPTKRRLPCIRVCGGSRSSTAAMGCSK